MHPENVRHLVGHGGSFQLGPVFVPVDDLHFNMYVGMLGRVSVAHGLHAVALGHIPDLKGQVYSAVICRASGQAGRHQRRKGAGGKAMCYFHDPSPFRYE